jgi:hypothetical protein
MYENDNAKYIEILNYYLGMEHRTEPFDLTKTDDLKRALKFAVAAYRDYSHYEHILDSVIELFDESLEHFDTASWVNMSLTPDNVDNLTMECSASLADASYNFCELVERTEENLSIILKVILTASDAVQRDILGNVYSITPDVVDEWICDLFDILDEVEYKYAIDDNLNDFLEVLNTEWKELAQPPKQGRT